MSEISRKKRLYYTHFGKVLKFKDLILNILGFLSLLITNWQLVCTSFFNLPSSDSASLKEFQILETVANYMEYCLVLFILYEYSTPLQAFKA